MTTAQVVEMSVTVNNNSPIQDYVHLDDQTQPTFEYGHYFRLPEKQEGCPQMHHQEQLRPGWVHILEVLVVLQMPLVFLLYGF